MFMQRGLLLVFAVEFYKILNFYRGLVTPMLMGSFANGLVAGGEIFMRKEKENWK